MRLEIQILNNPLNPCGKLVITSFMSGKSVLIGCFLQTTLSNDTPLERCSIGLSNEENISKI